MKKIIKSSLPILIVIMSAFIIRLVVMKELGVQYNLVSDDYYYVQSGIEFKETGKITIYGTESAQIMPGMPWLISIFVFIFGKGKMLWIALKLFWISMGCLSIYAVYKTMNIYANKIISAMVCLLFCVPDFAWMDNLILTETPFMLGSAFLVYNSIMLANTKKNKYYIGIVAWYMFTLMFRPTIALYPLFLFAFLLAKKYDIKLLLKQAVIAGLVLIAFVIPWSIRNYNLYKNFIPLTYGTGNPKLLGTYQGYGYPKDEDLDYIKNVDEKLPPNVKKYSEAKITKENMHLNGYATLEKDNYKAKYRMKVWWQTDKKSMIKSYCIHKPRILIYNTFYWKQVLNVKTNSILLIRKIELILCAILGIAFLIMRKRVKEILFIGALYIYQISVYSYTFAFDRYGQTLIFYRYIFIAWMLGEIYLLIKERLLKKKETKKMLNQ